MCVWNRPQFIVSVSVHTCASGSPYNAAMRFVLVCSGVLRVLTKIKVNRKQDILIHKHVFNEVTVVWGSFRLVLIIAVV